MIERRSFLKHASALALAAAAGRTLNGAVPNSTGDEKPKLKAPANAADCHMHIYDPARFPFPSGGSGRRGAPDHATVADYRLLQQRTGTTRVVVVTPRNYVTDNRVTVDAMMQLKPNGRAVAVVHPDVSNADLKMLHDAGVRGVRCSISNPNDSSVTLDMIEPLSKRCADMGWHIQLLLSAAQIAMMGDRLHRLPSPMVFDHMGLPGRGVGVAHPSHAVIRGLLDQGRTWVKLSGAYANGTAPRYAESTPLAQDFIKANPERMVWGSDWPHPSVATGPKPDDAVLFDLISEWAPDEATRNRILVRNPEVLYGW